MPRGNGLHEQGRDNNPYIEHIWRPDRQSQRNIPPPSLVYILPSARPYIGSFGLSIHREYYRIVSYLGYT